MELAGLACAQTLATTYRKDVYPRVLVCCGPGNQGWLLTFKSWTDVDQGESLNLLKGGDGLVAARHLGVLLLLRVLKEQLFYLFKNFN